MQQTNRGPRDATRRGRRQDLDRAGPDPGGPVTATAGTIDRVTPLPATPAAVAALAVATDHYSPALLQHALRSYRWAAAYAGQRAIPVDDELLYVAAVLHDLGLVEPFDSHRMDFEQAGGHVAAVLAAGAGWPPARRRRVTEVIVAHMADAVDPATDPEGHALEAATAFDISGRDIGIPPALRAAVLGEHPRLGLATEFTACFADQAARKPASTAAAAVRGGIAGRIAANPLDAPLVAP